jgi:hypothetical protein
VIRNIKTLLRVVTPSTLMLAPSNYKAYHIMKAIGDGEVTAHEIADKYNLWIEESRNKAATSAIIGKYIWGRLLGEYVEVCGERHPWGDRKGKRGVAVYRLTANGVRRVERFAYWWEK